MNHIPLDAALKPVVTGGYVNIDGERWYRITNAHLMPEFFMCPVSASDHWLFVSSKGAVSAGRRCANHALFPYVSSDKLSDTISSHGPRTILRVCRDGQPAVVWEPFAAAAMLASTSSVHLFKNDLGTKVLFEEINNELGLSFRYSWSFGSQFGFVRNCTLTSLEQRPLEVTILDGIENLLPYGLNQEFQLRYSNLGDAYKTSELVEETGLAVFSLSSIPTDRAEPNESLRATVAWQEGLGQPAILLSAQQVARFRGSGEVDQESSVRGRRGGYFVKSRVKFGADHPSSIQWKIVADVNCDHADVIDLNEQIRLARKGSSGDLTATIDDDVAANQDRLLGMVAAADAIQLGEQPLRTQRHQSNVLFNVMRGGLSICGYRICVVDFCDHVANANRMVFERHQDQLKRLPKDIDRAGLLSRVDEWGSIDLKRIALEYLPLTFSRRHGDPTRPWNSFSINFLNDDGSQSLSYEGNWRDIFQNWEALAHSFPQFTLGMIFRFLCASTADGYNPYRITKSGFEWETIEPNDPWANIGYWGDHQIIYLLKLLETSKRFDPQQLDDVLCQRVCCYAQVPYRIRDYAQLLNDPQKTIDFDYELAAEIQRRVQRVGADGMLVPGPDGDPFHVSMLEKLLLPALVKLTNFVPDGGVWMNTQRPEWNDANNALVGRGLSVVTTAYLRRYLAFLRDWFAKLESSDTVGVSEEVAQMLFDLTSLLTGQVRSEANDRPRLRRELMDGLSTIGSDYRSRFYNSGFSGKTTEVSIADCLALFDCSLALVDDTLRANQRDDGMFHAYNLLDLSSSAVEIEHLPEMLEGQVAILSSGMLSASEAADVLDRLRNSSLYRADQNSYLLYPDKQLPGFLDKNRVPCQAVEQSQLLQLLANNKSSAIVRRSQLGQYHFNADFRNGDCLVRALDQLQTNPVYAEWVKAERSSIESLYEQTFSHSHFTGRSGTFFAYEGLGSIYWHMVSKLVLATLENCVWAAGQQSCDDQPDAPECESVLRLHKHYQQIREGVGVNKSPDQYGAFPTDPYSHTPENAGVQQPGMTGQVKEDILSRVMELGVRIIEGKISFEPRFFESEELLQNAGDFRYVTPSQQRKCLSLEAGSFAFTLCQTPVVYRTAMRRGIVVVRHDGSSERRESLTVSRESSADIFARNGLVERIEVSFHPAELTAETY